MSSDEKITCQICGATTHIIKRHLESEHSEWDVERYKMEYPDAPIMSEFARKKLEAMRDEKRLTAMAGTAAAMVEKLDDHRGSSKEAMHEVFGLGSAPAARSGRGGIIPVTVLSRSASVGYEDLIPAKDKAYIFNIDLLKTALMGLEFSIPTYLWGHAGTGKTTMWEQIAAHTNRPFLRVQHTINTEESHVVGQYVIKDGETLFELGPLAVAMKYGLIYCADEYDFAMPSVLSVYQPVLEGKPLVIKEADAENRIIHPHQNFRFVATGNTNGIGDETGLYQGTNIQNAANYERFGVVEMVEYMPKSQEISVIVNQAGVPKEDATQLVKFASEVRNAYSGGKIGMTISPRALINAARIGMVRADYKKGLLLSFANRLSSVDREVVNQFAQRIFG